MSCKGASRLVAPGLAGPAGPLEARFATWAEPRRSVKVEGASHFFDSQLGELAKALREGLPAPA